MRLALFEHQLRLHILYSFLPIFANPHHAFRSEHTEDAWNSPRIFAAHFTP